MITVSNGVEKFTIRKEMIKKVERGIRWSLKWRNVWRNSSCIKWI